MWEHKYLKRIDWRIYPILLTLMIISFSIISSMTAEAADSFFSDYVRKQLQWFCLGGVVFFFFAGVDYRRLYEWSWLLYVAIIILLLGVYLAHPIANVHRWYKLPFGISFQPSEYAKLAVVLSLGWFLEKKKTTLDSVATSCQLLLIVGIPFLLILKQPDLGTALILYPISLIMAYIGDINKSIFRLMLILGACALIFVFLIFGKVLSHEKMKPVALHVLKEYQYERLNPNTYHQRASQIAIALGGISGSGWKKSIFSSCKWLPAAHTDSVFAAYAEEFGLMGVIVLLFIYYLLIYVSFETIASAKDRYGRLLASGIAVYFAMHIIVNIAMMCGFLPITGAPLIMLSYGGNSILTTMAALGILQSIYSRRFMF